MANHKPSESEVAPVTDKELAAGDVQTLLPVSKGWEAFFNDPNMAASTFLTNRDYEPAQLRELYGPL